MSTEERKLSFEDWGMMIFGWIFFLALIIGLLYAFGIFTWTGWSIAQALMKDPLGLLSAFGSAIWISFGCWAKEFFPNIHLVAFHIFYALSWFIAPAACIALVGRHSAVSGWRAVLCLALLIASSLCIIDSFRHPAKGGYVDYGSHTQQWVDDDDNN